MRPIPFRKPARIRRAAVLSLAAALLLLAGCGGDSRADPVAVVGDKTVAKSELDRLLDQARANSKGGGRPFPKPGTAEYLQIRGQLIEFLVQRAQVAAEADERGIEVSDEEVEQTREKLVRDYFGGKEDLYDKHLRENGVTAEQARGDIEARLLHEALVADVGDDVKVSEAELRGYYAKNKRKYGARPYEKVQSAVRKDLLRQKRIEASSKVFTGLARKHDVRYQAGFAPRV